MPSTLTATTSWTNRCVVASTREKSLTALAGNGGIRGQHPGVAIGPQHPPRAEDRVQGTSALSPTRAVSYRAFQDMDTNHDGKVSIEEWTTFFRKKETSVTTLAVTTVDAHPRLDRQNGDVWTDNYFGALEHVVLVTHTALPAALT